jgi:hypothetical protein
MNNTLAHIIKKFALLFCSLLLVYAIVDKKRSDTSYQKSSSEIAHLCKLQLEKVSIGFSDEYDFFELIKIKKHTCLVIFHQGIFFETGDKFDFYLSARSIVSSLPFFILYKQIKIPLGI